MKRAQPTDFKNSTVLAVQTHRQPEQIQVLAWSSNVDGSREAPTPHAFAIRPETTVTCLMVAPHGCVWAERSGRVQIEPCDLLESPDTQTQGRSRRTLWAGATVVALAWRSPNCLIAGDDRGRLLAFEFGETGHPDHAVSRHIASVASPWLTIIPIGKDRVAAVSTSGELAVLHNNGKLLQEDRLLSGEGCVSASHVSAQTSLLVYQTRTCDLDDGSGHPGPTWHAWDLDEHQAVPLPDVLRYADRLVPQKDGLLAFNTQGMSWRSSLVDTCADQRPEGTSAYLSAPQALRGWPAGPCRDVALLGDTLFLVHVDPQGQARVYQLDGDVWCLASTQLPETRYHQLSVTEPGAFSRAAAERREQRVQELSDQVLQAHTEERVADCHSLLDELTELSADTLRPAVLHARISMDRGDLLMALTHLRRAVMLGPNRGAGLLPFYGRLLWLAGAWDELASFDLLAWPGLTQRLPAGIDHAALINVRESLISLAPATAPGINESFATAITPLRGAAASDPQQSIDEHRWGLNTVEHGDGSRPGWQEHAWACVRRWGTCGPYWLGAERLPSLPLHPDDEELFDESMAACGADCRPLSVLSADGETRPTRGWVFRDALPSLPMQRQLVAWQSRGPTNTIAMCWTVSADRFAPPSAWAAAWESLHDPCWRADLERRLAIVRESLRCGLAPDPALLTRRSGRPEDANHTALDATARSHQEVHR